MSIQDNAMTQGSVILVFVSTQCLTTGRAAPWLGKFEWVVTIMAAKYNTVAVPFSIQVQNQKLVYHALKSPI